MRIPDFMRDFQRHVSHQVTRLRDGWNTVMFPKRYSCEPILDDAALRDKIDYVHLNPVRAGYHSAVEKWQNGDSDVTFPPGTRPPGWTRTRSYPSDENTASPSTLDGPSRGDPDADRAA